MCILHATCIDLSLPSFVIPLQREFSNVSTNQPTTFVFLLKCEFCINPKTKVDMISVSTCSLMNNFCICSYHKAWDGYDHVYCLFSSINMWCAVVRIVLWWTILVSVLMRKLNTAMMMCMNEPRQFEPWNSAQCARPEFWMNCWRFGAFRKICVFELQ